MVHPISTDRYTVPVSLPPELVSELDELVEAGQFGSRSEVLRYGARLVVREELQKRLHERTAEDVKDDIKERLDRKRVS